MFCFPQIVYSEKTHTERVLTFSCFSQCQPFARRFANFLPQQLGHTLYPAEQKSFVLVTEAASMAVSTALNAM